MGSLRHSLSNLHAIYSHYTTVRSKFRASCCHQIEFTIPDKLWQLNHIQNPRLPRHDPKHRVLNVNTRCVLTGFESADHSKLLVQGSKSVEHVCFMFTLVLRSWVEIKWNSCRCRQVLIFPDMRPVDHISDVLDDCGLDASP